jgi:excisionase family DNA binding protein
VGEKGWVGVSSKNNVKGYVGVYEFARETKQALNTIYQKIYLGKLPAEKIGRKWQIKKSVLEAQRAAQPASE